MPFLAAVALAAATMLLASRLGLPVSTTHALTGALVGAGVDAGSNVLFCDGSVQNPGEEMINASAVNRDRPAAQGTICLRRAVRRVAKLSTTCPRWEHLGNHKRRIPWLNHAARGGKSSQQTTT